MEHRACTFSIPAVYGAPRPRFTRAGRVYKDKRYKKFLKTVPELYASAGGIDFGEQPVSMAITCFSPLPKSKPKKVVSEPNVCKPDVDNVAKAVMDALNGVAYKDDKQVIRLTVQKMPRTRGIELSTVVYISDCLVEGNGNGTCDCEV